MLTFLQPQNKLLLNARILSIIVLAFISPQITKAQTIAEYHQRADVLLENYLLKYWDGNYIRNSGEWTYIHGMNAVIDGAERTKKQKYYGLIETFYEAQDRRHGWLNDFYDDENWFVLTLIHAYDVTKEKKYLDKAKEIFADIQNNAWDSTCCGTIKGGLWWNKPKTQKATAANAGAVISAVQLYNRTKNNDYRKFAKKVYDFWWENMVDKNTYQVADHIETDGRIVWWKFTYNEGLMIGASLELYKACKNPIYLKNAHKIANFMINNETVTNSYGKVLSDGNDSQCGGDCHQFKSPGYRYLMQLYLHDKSKRSYYNVLKASVNSLWDLARTSDNSVGVDWSIPSIGPYNDRSQNTAASAMSLFAIQNGNYPGSGIPEGQYEAENATIKGVLLESSQPGFEGWGFTGGWINSGTFIKFTINNKSAGNKLVRIKYAAAAGDAYRNIIVNDSLISTLHFPGTAGWNVYTTTTFNYYFPAGVSTIKIYFNSNFVNLDNIKLESSQANILTAKEISRLEVYPNPAKINGQIKVSFQAKQNSISTIRLTDIFAKTISTRKYVIRKGQNDLYMPVGECQPGTYLLHIEHRENIYVNRINIEE